MESVRRVTHTLEVGEPGAIVPLDFLLPSEALECFGLQAMVVGLIPSLESVDDFGEYSILFNGRQDHPVHHLVPYESAQTRQASSSRVGLLPVGVPISMSQVEGFYRDLSRQPEPFVPYRVKLSFNLIVQ